MTSRSEPKIKGILRTDNKSLDNKKGKKIKFSLLPSKKREVQSARKSEVLETLLNSSKGSD